MTIEPTTLEKQFENFVKEHSLLTKAQSVVLAVSGGIDSMAMMYLFHSIQRSWGLEIAIGHVNHQLRGEESDGDEAFVQETALSLELPFFSRRIDVGKHQANHHLSKQEAARELRYEAFESIRLDSGASAVATAHHADDNAETVFMNALRGAGIRGLAGIPVRRQQGNVIRPMLFATKEQLRGYAASRGFSYRKDSSNTSDVYTRNVVRNTIVPRLRETMQIDIVHSLNRLSAVMQSMQDRLEKECDERFPSIVSTKGGQYLVDLNTFREVPLYLREEMILKIFRTLGVAISVRKVQACMELCDRPTGRSIQLSFQWIVLRDRHTLIFSHPLPANAFNRRVEIGREYAFPEFTFAVKPVETVPSLSGHLRTVEYIDGGKLGSSLVLRTWRPGDWFMPLGMGGRQKVSDFFTNEKIPLTEKRSTPILESDGSIVWVCGHRLDQRFRITSSTETVARLNYVPVQYTTHNTR